MSKAKTMKMFVASLDLPEAPQAHEQVSVPTVNSNQPMYARLTETEMLFLANLAELTKQPGLNGEFGRVVVAPVNHMAFMVACTEEFAVQMAKLPHVERVRNGHPSVQELANRPAPVAKPA